MTNSALVLRKLGVIRDHLTRITSRRSPTEQAFSLDLVIQDATAMSLLVVTQEALDIALHIASEEGWSLGTSYRDAFSGMATHGLIPAELASQLALIAQLRNRIAHGYATLDARRLWQELPSGVLVFEAYVGAISVYLQRGS
jgi:uncharacterized protein YutE (UPF0331/DUF86 family)